MPARIVHAFESFWRAVIALYEPAVFYIAVAVSAVMAAASEAGSLAAGINGPWLEVAAYFVGSAADLHFRGRAYAKLPPDQRQSRLREWKNRLGLAAIGLAGAFFASLLAHAVIDAVWPSVSSASYPLVNFALVIIAVPVIDGLRGVFRLLSGADAQEAFAGLVIGWARRKSGDRSGGQGGAS
jgi:hypothetical protein